MITLDTLTVGQRARILDVQGDDAIAVRLLEMGLTDGEEIEMLGRAPLASAVVASGMVKVADNHKSVH